MGAALPEARVEVVPLPWSVTSLAAGRFSGGPREDLALLSDDGGLYRRLSGCLGLMSAIEAARRDVLVSRKEPEREA